MKDFIEKKVLPVVMKTVNKPSLVAIKDGFLATMPLTIIGSVFLLLASFPYLPIKEFFNNLGLTPILLQAFSATFNLLAIVAVFAIAYYYTRIKKVEPLNAGILATIAYILMTVFETKSKSGEVITNVLKLEYVGAKGMIAAILIGLVVGKIYSYFVGNNITIKMPPSVPQGVANSFIAIIPGIVIIGIATVIFGVLRSFNTTFIDLIYTFIQVPLQGLTSSFGGVLLMVFISNFLWWFGIHGASIVAGIMTGVLTANMNANQAILDAGQALTSQNGHIVTFNFRALITIITGSGITIGLVLFFLFISKSKQYKTLGKLSIMPSIFNINEPVLFGTPIVLNPILFVPFLLVPLICTTVAYFAMDFGLVPLMGAINPPWTTPAIISGLIAGGWRLALLQIVLIVISFVGYYPFIKRLDDIAYKNELNEASLKEN